MNIKHKTTCSQCNLPIYILFLLSEPKFVSCVRLSMILNNISHDSINRFLIEQQYQPRDLFEQVKDLISWNKGTLSVDDMVIDKPYSNPQKSELIDYFWSGKHHKTVKGINLITLYHTDVNGVSIPVNYRLVNKQEEKTKHDYFMDMFQELKDWGLKPLMVTGDSWYAKKDNLLFFKDKEQSFLFAIKSNRNVSLNNQHWLAVKELEIPDEGLLVYLKNFGRVKVFIKRFKNEARYYIVWFPDEEKLTKINREYFILIHNQHWGIEMYHRALKQVCNIERFQVRKTSAVKTHIYSSIIGFIQLELLRFNDEMTNWYQIKRNMFNEVIRSFIINHLSPEYKTF